MEFVSEKEKRDNSEKRYVFRRHILSELKIPLRNLENEDQTLEEYPGKPRPFIHPDFTKDKENEQLTLPKITTTSPGRKRKNTFQNIQNHLLPSLSEDAVFESPSENGNSLSTGNKHRSPRTGRSRSPRSSPRGSPRASPSPRDDQPSVPGETKSICNKFPFHIIFMKRAS